MSQTLLNLGGVIAISSGALHSCFIKENNSMVCLGNNDAGQLFIPGDLGSVSAVSAGAYHTCATKVDQYLVCWGNNEYSQAIVPFSLGKVLE